MAYQFGNAIFVGDTLQKLLASPPKTRLLMCHDYPPSNRSVEWESTVAQQRAHNIHVHHGINENEFVTMRNKHDATLEMPTLLLPSIQVNIRAGKLPPAERNGVAYFKIPINFI
ncbi:hypothetical protein SAMN05421510_106710 [Nitrosomonas ureae]|uniref:Uncharacterized protein n=1 Tax=Nitrosomonas ureae TaxID=44577 RepID=A0A1H9GKL4_9PROT|nr:hypothetical protein SAMN05421510_106710 [Nitrosomonas ureae]